LPYKKKQTEERDETIDERFQEEARRKPDLWYYKLDDKIVMNETVKVLQLNLVEVIIPSGYANVQFEKTEEGEVDEASKIILTTDSLKIALDKKKK
jgi:hypothetical protein